MMSPAVLPPGAAAPPVGAAPPPSNNGDGPTQVSSLPLPPLQYIKCYTDEAVARGCAPPPPPPIMSEPYTMFGVPFPPMASVSAGGSSGRQPADTDASIIQSLESQGFRRLYSTKDVDRKKELRKLNHSILVNFLDLLDILIKCPDTVRREEKLEDVNLLFIHMHHLINEFRPHQARETLRVMLHVQKRKRLQVAEKFQSHLDKVQETIQEALDSLPETEDDDNKLLIPNASELESMETNEGEEEIKETCNSLDRIMCQIVDEITLD